MPSTNRLAVFGDGLWTRALKVRPVNGGRNRTTISVFDSRAMRSYALSLSFPHRYDRCLSRRLNEGCGRNDQVEAAEKDSPDERRFGPPSKLSDASDEAKRAAIQRSGSALGRDDADSTMAGQPELPCRSNRYGRSNSIFASSTACQAWEFVLSRASILAKPGG